MGIANCKECGKVFIKTLDTTCPDCSKKREQDLQKIFDWIKLKDTPVLTKIENDIGISDKTFMKYLLDGRIKSFNKVLAPCDMCGTLTRLETKNIICKDCRSSIKKTSSTTDSSNEISKSDMYSKTHKELPPKSPGKFKKNF